MLCPHTESVSVLSPSDARRKPIGLVCQKGTNISLHAVLDNYCLYLLWAGDVDGVKELTKRPLMQANSKVLSPPIPLHSGSLHFDTLLKLQITHFFFFFWQHKGSSWGNNSPKAAIGTCTTWLLGAGRQNLQALYLFKWYQAKNTTAEGYRIATDMEEMNILTTTRTIKAVQLWHVDKNCNYIVRHNISDHGEQ